MMCILLKMMYMGSLWRNIWILVSKKGGHLWAFHVQIGLKIQSVDF